MPVCILDHPLAAHIMTHLRDVTTKPATFRTLAYQLSLLLAIDATRDLETEDKVINTPLEPAKIDWLLAELAKTEHPTSCPHGRPIALRYSYKDVQKAFQRI